MFTDHSRRISTTSLEVSNTNVDNVGPTWYRSQRHTFLSCMAVEMYLMAGCSDAAELRKKKVQTLRLLGRLKPLPQYWHSYLDGPADETDTSGAAYPGMPEGW